jgi:hypothetical protein
LFEVQRKQPNPVQARRRLVSGPVIRSRALVGGVESGRVFESAEAAMAFLASVGQFDCNRQ